MFDFLHLFWASRVSTNRIGTMLPQQFRAFLVVKDTTQPVAVAVRRKVGSYASLADRIHIDA